MYLKANVQFVLKNKPKGYVGLCGARVCVDNPESESVTRLLCGLIESSCEMAAELGIIRDTEQLQQSLEYVRQYSKTLVLVDEKGGEP